jgi:hypothetical protein
MSRLYSFAMPAVFTVALLVSLIRVGATTTHEFFVEKPHLNAGEGAATPKLEWLAPDADANWVVRYRNGATQAWEQSSASVSSRVRDEELRVRRLYKASLQRLAPGDRFEFEVFRNGEKAFAQSGSVPSVGARQSTGL